jgi:hypothetical protein
LTNITSKTNTPQHSDSKYLNNLTHLTIKSPNHLQETNFDIYSDNKLNIYTKYQGKNNLKFQNILNQYKDGIDILIGSIKTNIKYKFRYFLSKLYNME